MSLSRLPSKRWRARVWSAAERKQVPVGPVLGLPAGTTWATKGEAKAAREKARSILRGYSPHDTTVLQWWERWTTDRMFSRPKESTNIHNRERTKAFVERYGDKHLSAISRGLVKNEWLAGGQRNGTIPALRAMFNDAIESELIESNPFARLGISKTRGNADVDPPSQEMVWKLIRAARQVSCYGFAAWLQVAAFTGMRPGELDALRWDAVDFDRSRIEVREQWSGRAFTLPKNGKRREALLTPPARDALTGLQRDSEFCFVNLQGKHWTATARAYHFKAVKAAAGYDGTLYLATRHAAGSYMTNELLLPSEDVAIALGHTDGGDLVRRLYGHRDREKALDRVLEAYEGRTNVVELKAVREE